MKKKVLIALILAVYMVNFSFTGTSAATLPENTTALQSATVDVTGDGQKDTITLYGQKFEEGYPFYQNIYVAVNDTVISLPEASDGGYDPKFAVKDFNGDKIPDVFISTATGGSGGIMYYHIYSLKDGNADLIFSPTEDSAITVNGSFQPQYKVNLTVQQIKKTFALDFSSRKDMYDELQVYNNGELLKPVDIAIDYYGKVTPLDTNSDGVFELQGIQAVWGVAHVDTLAHIKSTWKWANGKWKLIKVQVIKADW
jgi:hypothetical protein